MNTSKGFYVLDRERIRFNDISTVKLRCNFDIYAVNRGSLNRRVICEKGQ